MAKRLSVISWVFLLPMLVVTTATAERLSDPLRPVNLRPAASTVTSNKAAKSADWKLSAVLLSKQRSVAVINDKTLQLDDVIDGYKVVKITASMVTLENKEQQFILRRSGTGLKQISKQDIVKGSKL